MNKNKVILAKDLKKGRINTNISINPTSNSWFSKYAIRQRYQTVIFSSGATL